MTAAQLSFRNATSGELTIKFYRGLIGSNGPKKTQTIGAEENAQCNFVAKGPFENVNATALLAIGGTDVMRCSFMRRSAAQLVGSIPANLRQPGRYGLQFRSRFGGLSVGWIWIDGGDCGPGPHVARPAAELGAEGAAEVIA